MKQSITRFPFHRFRELHPMVLRCFPDFWKPRFTRGCYDYPYDVRLWTLKTDGELAGGIGLHPYPFFLGGRAWDCGGLCDVCILPEFRGQGLARFMQKHVLRYTLSRTQIPMIALYTEKPDVYRKQGWTVYESDRTTEMTSAVFPKKGTGRSFSGSHPDVRRLLKKNTEKCTEEERTVLRIMELYRNGHVFPGKCVRGPEVWNELFREPEHEWIVEENRYFLYRKERLLEAYGKDPSDPVCRYTPAHGGHDGNLVMLHLLGRQDQGLFNREFTEAVKRKTLVFPASDTF